MASAGRKKLTVELTLTYSHAPDEKKTTTAKQRAEKCNNERQCIVHWARLWTLFSLSFRQNSQYYLIIIFDKLLLLMLCLAPSSWDFFSAQSLSQFIDLLQLNLYCVFSCFFPPLLPCVCFQQSMFLFLVRMLLFLYIILAHTHFLTRASWSAFDKDYFSNVWGKNGKNLTHTIHTPLRCKLMARKNI